MSKELEALVIELQKRAKPAIDKLYYPNPSQCLMEYLRCITVSDIPTILAEKGKYKVVPADAVVLANDPELGEETMAIKVARQRVANAGRFKVGSEIHLCEMLLDEIDQLKKTIKDIRNE